MYKPKGLPLGEIGVNRHVHDLQRCTLSKGRISFWDPWILEMPNLGSHIDLDQLENELTPYFKPMATSELAFFLVDYETPSYFPN